MFQEVILLAGRPVLMEKDVVVPEPWTGDMTRVREGTEKRTWKIRLMLTCEDLLSGCTLAIKGVAVVGDG